MEGYLQEFLQQYMCPFSVEMTCLAAVLTRAAVLRRPTAVPPMAHRQPDVQLLLGPGTIDRQDIVRTDFRAPDGPRGTTSVGPTDDDDLGPEFQREFNAIVGPMAGRIA